MNENQLKELKKPIYSIYCIQNKQNGMKYIGQTTKPVQDRWDQHKQWSRLGGTNSLIHKALKEFGEDAFEFTVLNTAHSLDQLDYLEKEAVKEFNTVHPHGYNMTAGGKRGRRLKGFQKTPSVELKLANGMSLSEFKDLVMMMRNNGVTFLKKDGLEITLSTEALFPESDYIKKKKDAEMKADAEKLQSEAEKVMFWSAPDAVAQ